MAVIVNTRDPLLTSPYIDPDALGYGETPAAKEIEIRNAATPAGSGTLVIKRTSVTAIVESERVGFNLTWEASYDIRVRYRDDATPKLSTTLAANSTVGASNVKLTSVAGLAISDFLTLVTTGFIETRRITAVGTAGSGGTGITLDEGLAYAHTSGNVAAAYYWGSWSPWVTVKTSAPPATAASTPADNALVVDPTLDLVNTYSSPSSKPKVSGTYRVYLREGYFNRALASAPSSYFRLAEASGSFLDQIATGIVGTAVGGMTRAAPGLLEPVDPDAAVNLNGTTGYITFGDVYDFAGTAPFTVAILVKPDTLTGGMSIVSKNSASADGWSIYTVPDGTVTFGRAASVVVSEALISEPGLLVAGQRVLLVVTYDGPGTNNYHLAVNGAESEPYTGTVSMPGNANLLTIGRYSASAVSFWDGTLDALMIWSRALSAAERLELFSHIDSIPGDQLIREVTMPGAGLTDTLPRLFLSDATPYGWEKDVIDSEGLVATTTRRAFATQFSTPAPVNNLVATTDPDTSSVVLEWDASVDPYLDHYRVYWRNASGDWVRIDGGPAVLDDGLPPLTDATFTDFGGRFGDNAYRVTVHNGALESDPTDVEATVLSPTEGGSWLFVVPDQERFQFPLRVVGAPRTHGALIEEFTPPGRGETVHLTWGRSGRRISVQILVRPTEDGDISTLLSDLMGDPLTGRVATPGYLKAPAGWMWEPMWCLVVGLTDSPGVGGMLTISADFASTAR